MKLVRIYFIMENDKREDSFNAWIRTEAKKRGLNIQRHPEEECWIVMYGHRDSDVQVDSLDDVKDLIDYANSEGYKCRFWLEERKTDRHHKHLSDIICFCYNG